MHRKILIVCLILFLTSGLVRAESSDSARLAIEKAERTINEMIEMGFGITYANDTLNEAKILFNQGYYEASEALAKKVLEIKKEAIEVDELIDQVEAKIYELSSKGYDTSDVSDIFNEGLSDFAVDNYLDAKKVMRDALNRLDELEAEELAKSIQTREFDLLPILLDYLWLLIILFLFAMITGFKVKERINIKNWRAELKHLKEEMKNVNKLLADAQKKYFKSGTISKMDYDLLSKKYNNRISIIKRRISVLNEKLKNH